MLSLLHKHCRCISLQITVFIFQKSVRSSETPIVMLSQENRFIVTLLRYVIKLLNMRHIYAGVHFGHAVSLSSPVRYASLP